MKQTSANLILERLQLSLSAQFSHAVKSKWSRDQKSLHIGFPMQNKIKPQPFSLFLMIFKQVDLKITQTSANILSNCLLLSISERF